MMAMGLASAPWASRFWDCWRAGQASDKPAVTIWGNVCPGSVHMHVCVLVNCAYACVCVRVNCLCMCTCPPSLLFVERMVLGGEGVWEVERTPQSPLREAWPCSRSQPHLPCPLAKGSAKRFPRSSGIPPHTLVDPPLLARGFLWDLPIHLGLTSPARSSRVQTSEPERNFGSRQGGQGGSRLKATEGCLWECRSWGSRSSPHQPLNKESRNW